MSDDTMIDNMKFKIAEILLLQKQGIKYDPNDPIAAILCAHLKFFIISIIQTMTMYKRKIVLCPMLNKRRNPKRPYCAMSREIVYENTLFTAKDFFKLLKDNQDLIPRQHIYNICMESLMNLLIAKPSLPERVEKSSEETKPAAMS